MMAGRLWPKLAPVFWLLAVGCGLSRVLAKAHFVSDVVLAALCAWPLVDMLWWWNRREVERHHLVPWPPPLHRELQREAANEKTKPQRANASSTHDRRADRPRHRNS